MTEENKQFFAGSGEMATLTRMKDWGKTPVGPVHTWPQSLRTTLGIVLNSKFPMFLWWGPELICFYNDAYRPSLGRNGKHFSILGMPAKDAWPEIWHIIKPLIDQVLERGEATWSENQLIPIFRNGEIQDVYWTFSYSPVHSEAGTIAGVLVTCSETTDYVMSLKKVEENEERLNIVISASELGTWEVNFQTKEIQYSNRYTEILGYKEKVKLTHEQLLTHLHPDDLNVRKEAYDRAFATGILHYETRIIWSDQSVHWIEAKGKVFFDNEKKPVKMLGTIRDRTEEKTFASALEKVVQERTGQLEQKNNDLEKMNKELQSFAYVSSHDLQEPLRKIQTFASWIRGKEDQNLSDKARDYFTKIQEAANRMQILIQDLLAYSRTNIITPVVKRTDLNKILQEVENDFRETLTEHDVVIQHGEMCHADIIPFQFRQLLYNLISNSIKFSKPGEHTRITIKSAIVNTRPAEIPWLSSTTAYCHISVSDNGIGFDPKYKERIFEVFQRLHGKDEYSGTGIGLAIVKKIVENHKGAITATGNLNEGATFDVYLPFDG
jgi:PAS domain S-box-containing protein